MASINRRTDWRNISQRSHEITTCCAQKPSPFGVASLRQASGYTATGCSTPTPGRRSQFKKRLHGHGAFPKLAQLGGALEMRTNWDLFAEEFALAADLIGLKGSIDMVSPAAPMTLFERKYQERGQTLWRFSGEFSN